MMIAQVAMKISSTNAVMPGQKNATALARMLTTPPIASHHRDAVSPPSLTIAAHSPNMPSANA